MIWILREGGREGKGGREEYGKWPSREQHVDNKLMSQTVFNYNDLTLVFIRLLRLFHADVVSRLGLAGGVSTQVVTCRLCTSKMSVVLSRSDQAKIGKYIGNAAAQEHYLNSQP